MQDMKGKDKQAEAIRVVKGLLKKVYGSQRAALETILDDLEHRPPAVAKHARHVWNANGTAKGRLTGGQRGCFDGCSGPKLGVRWPDGRMTWPCVKAMFVRKDGDWQIEKA